MKKLSIGLLCGICLSASAVAVAQTFVFPVPSVHHSRAECPLPHQGTCIPSVADQDNFCGTASDSSDGCFATDLSVPGCKIVRKGKGTPSDCFWSAIHFGVENSPVGYLCGQQKNYCINQRADDTDEVYAQCVAEINFFKSHCK